MKIEITLSNKDARAIEQLLQQRYNSKAKLKNLAKRALFEVVGLQANIELMRIAKEGEE